jgi:hypothetical protein
MRHIDHRNSRLVAQAHQVGEDFRLARGVERGKRLVEQEQARLRQERAADGDALALAAGERAGPPLEKMLNAEHCDHAGCAPPRRAEIHASSGHSRDFAPPTDAGTGAILKHIADAAQVRRQVAPRRGIEQHIAVDLDAAAVGRNEPRDHVHDRGLAGARGPVQSGDAGAGLEIARRPKNPGRSCPRRRTAFQSPR